MRVQPVSSDSNEDSLSSQPEHREDTGAASSGRQHRGDFVSPETRSAVMSRIRGRDTGPELKVQAMLKAMGLEFESQVRSLPGRPDFVLRQHSLCIFVDGDFWHGWRFETWRMKLSEKWEAKIAETRRRDERNRRRLRNAGWQVLRIWEHQINESPYRCRRSIVLRVDRGLPFDAEPGNIANEGIRQGKFTLEGIGA